MGKAAPAKPAPSQKRKLVLRKGKNDVVVAGGAAGGQRRRYERTSWEMAARAVKLKLGMYPKTQLENNRCSENLTVVEAVHREQIRVKKKGGHIVIGFWQSLI